MQDEDLGRYASQTGTWLSPTTWTRVYAADEEDLTRRRICAPLTDDGSVFVDEHEDELFELLRAEWREHIAPEDHARSISTVAAAIVDAHQRLDLEVVAARAAGLSWADIARAANISRQAARQRWGES